jgi:hypothetical protein
MENRLYPKSYGAWAGNPAGSQPNFALCCEEVADYSTRFPMYHQCRRKRGFGPDQAYCKQHDPAAKKAREEEQNKKYIEGRNKRMVEWNGPAFLEALRKIADGHNDARGLARETIAKFEEKLR